MNDRPDALNPPAACPKGLLLLLPKPALSCCPLGFPNGLDELPPPAEKGAPNGAEVELVGAPKGEGFEAAGLPPNEKLVDDGAGAVEPKGLDPAAG